MMPDHFSYERANYNKADTYWRVSSRMGVSSQQLDLDGERRSRGADIFMLTTL